jgi:hypothetical protein
LTPLKVRKRSSAIAGLPTTPQQTKKRHVLLDEEDVQLRQEFCRKRKGEISEEVQELESRIAALKAKKRALEDIEEDRRGLVGQPFGGSPWQYPRQPRVNGPREWERPVQGDPEAHRPW